MIHPFIVKTFYSRVEYKIYCSGQVVTKRHSTKSNLINIFGKFCKLRHIKVVYCRINL